MSLLFVESPDPFHECPDISLSGVGRSTIIEYIVVYYSLLQILKYK